MIDEVLNMEAEGRGLANGMPPVPPPPEASADDIGQPEPADDRMAILRGPRRALSLLYLIHSHTGAKESAMPPAVFEVWAGVSDAFDAVFDGNHPHVGERVRKGDPWKVDEMGMEVAELRLTKPQFDMLSGIWSHANLSFYRLGNGHAEQRRRRAFAREAIAIMKAAAESLEE